LSDRLNGSSYDPDGRLKLCSHQAPDANAPVNREPENKPRARQCGIVAQRNHCTKLCPGCTQRYNDCRSRPRSSIGSCWSASFGIRRGVTAPLCRKFVPQRCRIWKLQFRSWRTIIPFSAGRLFSRNRKCLASGRLRRSLIDPEHLRVSTASDLD